jgi:hypothetical protein
MDDFEKRVWGANGCWGDYKVVFRQQPVNRCWYCLGLKPVNLMNIFLKNEMSS